MSLSGVYALYFFDSTVIGDAYNGMLNNYLRLGLHDSLDNSNEMYYQIDRAPAYSTKKFVIYSIWNTIIMLLVTAVSSTGRHAVPI